MTPRSAGTNPLRMSSAITGTPSEMPALRKTLLAPMLPEPISRMSWCRKSLTSQ